MRLSRQNGEGKRGLFKAQGNRILLKQNLEEIATAGTWEVYKGSVDSAKCCREL